MTVMTSSLAPPEEHELTLSTARFTWRELLGPYAAMDDGWSGLRTLDADRDNLPCGSPELRKYVAATPAVGGILLWNRTLDEESGDLIMLTGQDCEAERRIVRNATWLASCGAHYAARRVGMSGWKACPDFKFRVGGRQGDLLFAWILRNDRDVEGFRR